jgi:hypothetical protein
MRKQKFLQRDFALASALWLVVAGSALADTNSAADSSVVKGRHGGRVGKRPAAAASPEPGSIRGTCTVAQSSSNPFPGPCINLLLVLKDAQGNEAFKARTNPQGQFEFLAEQDKPYKISCSSKFYETVSPTDAIHAGERVSVVLKQN